MSNQHSECDSALRAEPADLRHIIGFALDLAEGHGAQNAVNFLMAWNWESDTYLRSYWPEFAEYELASRFRAEGGNTKPDEVNP